MNFIISHIEIEQSHNKMWQPIKIEVFNFIKTELKIYGRTYGRGGSKVMIIDSNGDCLDKHYYSYHSDGSGYFPKMAKDVAESMNIVFELKGEETRIDFKSLLPLMKEVFEKCESGYGNEIPNSEYEAAILFN